MTTEEIERIEARLNYKSLEFAGWVRDMVEQMDVQRGHGFGREDED